MQCDATAAPIGFPLLKHAFCLLALALLALAPATYADERAKGPNGGQIKDAGKYHVELVMKPDELRVFVTDAKDAKVDTNGADATATVLAGKDKFAVKLTPTGGNALAGSGKFDAAAGAKIVVSLTLPNQAPLQARFSIAASSVGK